MARPRVFVSSTYYDLKYLRSSLDVFIETLGYDAILSEKGDIAYAHDRPLDESCYQEVTNCDILVLLIGGRYGSAASAAQKAGNTFDAKTFFERYESVTKQEYKTAVETAIPVYVLIERPVYAEYQTFLKNRDNTAINYAHVDSANVFHFIEHILQQHKNNPIQQFDRPSDVESWLREQWAGLFRDLLNRRSGQKQITSLASQVQALSEVNKTLKRYLEEVMVKVAPDSAPGVIHDERKRLDEAWALDRLAENDLVRHLRGMYSDRLNIGDIHDALIAAKSFGAFLAMINIDKETAAHLEDMELAQADADDARKLMGLEPWRVIQKLRPSKKPTAHSDELSTS